MTWLNPTSVRMAIMLAMLMSLLTGAPAFAGEDWGGG